MRYIGYILTGILSLSLAVGAGAQNVSLQRLEQNVQALRASGQAGRPAGSTEGLAAAEYIAGAFEKAGLNPFFAGQYIDEFTAEPLVGEAKKTYRNVAGIIYGNNYEFDGEYIVIGAHYDYSGSAGNSSYTVVEDNASGVSALIEMAYAVKECSPGRNVVFVAFDGFEAGLLGSRQFLAESPVPAESMAMMVNLSGLGRMPYHDVSLFISSIGIDLEVGGADEKETLTFFRSENVTEKQTKHFMDVYHSQPLGVRADWDYGHRTDTEPFEAAGVPSLHVTVAASGYRPGARTEEIDFQALQKVTGFIAEGVCNVANDTSVDRDVSKIKARRKGSRFEGGVSILAGTSFLRETDGDMRGKTLFSGGAGVYGQVNFGGNFGLRPEVQYIHSGSRSTQHVARMNSVVVPVSFVIQTPPYLAGSLQLLVGGYYRRTFNNTGGFNGFEAMLPGTDIVSVPDMYQNGAGVQWGLNLRIKKFGIGVVSRYGLTDIYRISSGNNLRERTTYGTISYNF